MPDANNPNPPKPAPAKPAKRSIQAPKGTRDLYPDDANLRRFITESWRNASIRHGFGEIDGPTFEDADLYKVKSGDGILAEMFGVFSGKDPTERENLAAGGEAPYALRPEFTPTLARMYAARAAQLGKPTKWFTAGPFFRAERPQRGRLREFLQWNVDFIGLPTVAEPSPTELDGSAKSDSLLRVQRNDAVDSAKALADNECLACCVDLFRSLGLGPKDLRIHVNDRRFVEWRLKDVNLPPDRWPDALRLLDAMKKLDRAALLAEAARIGLAEEALVYVATPDGGSGGPRWIRRQAEVDFEDTLTTNLGREVDEGWIKVDPTIVRGLAYYTGMVFEVIADGERAVAGGGRYDNLIELFGGPPTPAVGFGMGDVVLTNLLRDKGLLPEGKSLLDKLSQTPASLRPDAFVLTADESLDPLVRQLVADLRRGASGGGMVAALGSHANSPDQTNATHGSAEPEPCHTAEPCRPLHARHSYKSTRNVGKLLKEAAAQHARVAIIIENATTATLKPLDGGDQFQCPLAEVPGRLAGLVAR